MSVIYSIDFEAGFAVVRRFHELVAGLRCGWAPIAVPAHYPIELVKNKKVADAYLNREGGLARFGEKARDLCSRAVEGEIPYDGEFFLKEYRESEALLRTEEEILVDADGAIRSAIMWSRRWCDFLRDASRLKEPIGALLESFCVLCAAGYKPLSWYGPFPQGHLVVYAPGMALSLPEDWRQKIVGRGVAEQPVRQVLNRAQFAPSLLPVEPESVWNSWLSLSPSDALCAAFSPLLEGADSWAQSLLLSMAGRVERVQILGNGMRRKLVFDVRPVDSVNVRTISCCPPYRGSLSGLNENTARVLRRFNGVVSTAGLPEVTWFPYREGKGFVYPGWKDWELSDNYDGMWNKMPLIPISDGSDLWLFHPRELEGGYLRFMKLNHETGGVEPAFTYHPFAQFIRLCSIYLRVNYS